ncbi:PAN domain-containing protein [Eleftheria terrae]|uniref:PAN domain-containing protein n=1 Tax=Eleftheria terrae TaxID=1597781 RepID=UPI00263B4560|nr:PAN domain-containing protein [Eleftheria terrae]WKB51795.1 PAN domain-containing protein [Eleftheria terrae]
MKTPSFVMSLLAIPVALAALASPATAAPASVEFGIDRPGADYARFELSPDYTLCKSACENDARCQAYTYVHPGVQGSNAACWLKSAAPLPQASGCCYSGVKQVTREIGWDRPGSDYTNFDLPWSATADACEAYCRGDARCVAYTYVRPRVQGPNPRCWLKNRIPAPTPNGCCDSGTVNWR